MARLLTETEKEWCMDFIVPFKFIPEETAKSIAEIHRRNLREQLDKVYLIPQYLKKFKAELRRYYQECLIAPGESVGIISAQSIGEKNTQSTLNSIDWLEKILYTKDGKAYVEPIGEFIDRVLALYPEEIDHIPENRTEYLKLTDGEYFVPSCDENGNTSWKCIEAVTRHLPVGQLVKVTTQSGRSVCATQSKSFLVWDGSKFVGVNGSDVKVGDFLPTTTTLAAPKATIDYFDMETIFPKTDYLYTDEVIKALTYKKSERHWWLNHAGKDFVVPYRKADAMFDKRGDFFDTCKPGLVYIHRCNKFQSHFPAYIPLDGEFGFLIGIYLAEGCVTKTFVSISNKDPVIRKRITDWCDNLGVTYNLVTAEAKNVRNGTSVDLKLHSVLLARLLKSICDTGSSEKHVPLFAYTAPEVFIKGLIDGYFSGDGSVNKDDGSISVGSVSKDLITGVSFLLSYFGIFGRVSNTQQLKNNVGSKHIKPMYTLKITNGFAQIFANKFKLTESHKQEKLTAITLAKKYRYEFGRSQEEFPVREVYFDKVVSVELVDSSTEYVYDLTVADTRNFQLFVQLNLRDTFHLAGLGISTTVTKGLPRAEELLQVPKKTKMVNAIVYLSDRPKNIMELRKLITGANCISEETISTVSQKTEVIMTPSKEEWHGVFEKLFDTVIPNGPCINIQLDTAKLFRLRLLPRQIAAAIEAKFSDVICIWSPLKEACIQVYPNVSHISLEPGEEIGFVDQDNFLRVYMEENVLATLRKTAVCGVPGVQSAFYSAKGEEWYLETEGCDFAKLLGHPLVDSTRTVSNNVWDIYNCFGIEAARQAHINEFRLLLGEGVNDCHIELLVDKMTHTGIIKPISRQTLKREDSGVISKASFEESVEIYLDSAFAGGKEHMKGVAASVICGKRAKIGTGMMELKVNINEL